MVITIEKVEKILKVIRKYPDLMELRNIESEDFCKNHGITQKELTFLVTVVAAERFNKQNILLKNQILKRRNKQ